MQNYIQPNTNSCFQRLSFKNLTSHTECSWLRFLHEILLYNAKQEEEREHEKIDQVKPCKAKSESIASVSFANQKPSSLLYVEQSRRTIAKLLLGHS